MESATVKISVIGAGNIGGTLGGKWAAQGHGVVFGVRDPGAPKMRSLLAKVGHGATAVSIQEAIGEADVVLFAIPGRVLAETVAGLGGRLNGKILIDATNNVGTSPMHQLESLRQSAPDSPLFRAFSSLGWENFADPDIGGIQVDLFYCGDEGSAQPIIHDLIADVGLRPIYLGNTQQADIVDALTRLWFNLALQQGYGRHLAFNMVTEAR
jgi:predicted dinucleotide-binding enzyme